MSLSRDNFGHNLHQTLILIIVFHKKSTLFLSFKSIIFFGNTIFHQLKLKPKLKNNSLSTKSLFAKANNFNELIGPNVTISSFVIGKLYLIQSSCIIFTLFLSETQLVLNTSNIFIISFEIFHEIYSQDVSNHFQ